MVASGEIRGGYDWRPELLTEKLDLDLLRGSWLYETSHLVMWDVPQAHKCISPEDLSRRFARLVELSDGELWAARPDDVVDYVLLRRNLTAEVVGGTERGVEIELRGEWPIGVIDSRLSLRVSGLPQAKACEVAYRPSPMPGGSLRSRVYGSEKDGRDWVVTVDAVPGARVTVSV